MKKVVLIGASGFVGYAILKEALHRGHQVTAVVRNPRKIIRRKANLIVKQGDVSSCDVLASLCKGVDAVISAYNPGYTDPHLYQKTLQVYPQIVEGVKKSGIKRLLVVGNAGSLFLCPTIRMIDTDILSAEFFPAAKSLTDFYVNSLSKENELDWVYFCPPANLIRGERTGKFRLGKNNLVIDRDGWSGVSVEDYAVAMIDELEKPNHHREHFTIGY